MPSTSKPSRATAHEPKGRAASSDSPTRFEPFGEDWNNARSFGLNLRLPGQWDDAAWNNTQIASGLYYNLRRWYDPQIGRYTAPDPYKHAKRVYDYVDQQPTRWTDPLGLFKVDDSCYCKFGQSGPDSATGLGATIAKACSYLKRPGCKEAMKLANNPNWADCYNDRCNDGLGKGPTIFCQVSGGPDDPCGWTPIAGPSGQIVLYDAPGNVGCPRRMPAGKPPTGPRDYSQTLFHEVSHSCGLPANDQFNWPSSTTRADVEIICTGWPE